MKARRILCIAAVLCLLWTATAAADGYGYDSGYGYNYAVPVNIMQQSARPYHWDLQLRDNGTDMTYWVDRLLDGYRGTAMEHVCWNNESIDDIPEITFYFAGATIKDLWIRNAYDNTDEQFVQYARPYNICVSVWVGNEDAPRNTYRFLIPDEWDSSAMNAESYDGYRCLSLPKRFENVTKVDLWIKGWHKGDDAYRTKYIMQISDLAFLPDSLTALYGPRVFDASYSGGYYQAPTPTLVPLITATPAAARPAATSAPFTGLQVLTKERLATRSGPGTNYTEQGSYFQAGTWVKAISAAYDSSNKVWWVQVELTYNGELRRVYTGVKRLQMSADQVPAEEAECEAVVTRSVWGYWGPGYGYSMYGDKIPAGTTGTVWQREGLYAQFEFFDKAKQKLCRVWVPNDVLEEEDAVG